MDTWTEMKRGTGNQDDCQTEWSSLFPISIEPRRSRFLWANSECPNLTYIQRRDSDGDKHLLKNGGVVFFPGPNSQYWAHKGSNNVWVHAEVHGSAKKLGRET